MKELLQYRDKEYFDQRPNEEFLFFTMAPMMKISKIEKIIGNWWFAYPGLTIKAITMPCIAINELHRLRVHYVGYPEITGTIGKLDSVPTLSPLNYDPFVFVFWDKSKNIKQPMAYAWTSLSNLVLNQEKPTTTHISNRKPYPEYLNKTH